MKIFCGWTSKFNGFEIKYVIVVPIVAGLWSLTLWEIVFPNSAFNKGNLTASASSALRFN